MKSHEITDQENLKKKRQYGSHKVLSQDTYKNTEYNTHLTLLIWKLFFP